MNYREALQFLHERSAYDRGFISNPFAGDDAAARGLRRTRAVLDRLGSPDRRYSIIHVAGTKGKGSTCAMIEALLRAGGLRTGLFISPHLHSIRERIQVDSRPVSEEVFAAHTARAAHAAREVESRLPELGRLTAFELSTAMALDAFARADAESVVLEVGLGGRLDATNAVKSTVSVITPVSYDHMEVLGETLAKIAGEKAGIIKPGQPVVIAEQRPEALDVIERVASRKEATIFRAGADWRVVYGNGLAGFSGPWGTYEGIEIGLAGRHQAENAGTALAAVWLVKPSIAETESVVRRALSAVRLPGRFEVVASNPAIVLDGAHNTSSMARLVETLRERFPDSRFVIVFGAYRGKDVAGMLGELAALHPRLIATRSRSPRAMEPEALRDLASGLGLRTETSPGVADSLERAKILAGGDDVICATGSFSVVVEARDALGLACISHDERAVFQS